MERHFRHILAKKEPGSLLREPGIYLATTYSHRTYRPTTIGAAAFHFRVRNGTGWFHRAVVTRGQFQGQGFLLLELGLWGSELGALSIDPIGLISLIGPILIYLADRSLTSTRRKRLFPFMINSLGAFYEPLFLAISLFGNDFERIKPNG